MAQDGYPGQAGLSSGLSKHNAIQFAIMQALRRVQTSTLVQVKKVKSGTGVNPVGLLDVLPLVNMQDGLGNVQKHGIVHNLPYFRLQGGLNAVICDPAVGDIGLAVFASRDISSVKVNKKQSNPGSRRLFDWADGLYIGGFLNAAPVQYVYFTAVGITILDKNGNTVVLDNNGVKTTDTNNNVVTMSSTGMNLTDKNGNTIVMDSTGIKINGVKVDQTQNLTNVKNMTNQSNIDFNGHFHGGVTTGSGNTGAPAGG